MEIPKQCTHFFFSLVFIVYFLKFSTGKGFSPKITSPQSNPHYFPLHNKSFPQKITLCCTEFLSEHQASQTCSQLCWRKEFHDSFSLLGVRTKTNYHCTLMLLLSCLFIWFTRDCGTSVELSCIYSLHPMFGWTRTIERRVQRLGLTFFQHCWIQHLKHVWLPHWMMLILLFFVFR